ncbi:MAG: Fe-S cluster domain-containing protein [Tenuifilaceae bacterium]
MNTAILFAVITLSAIGVLAAVILYFIAQKFKVIEDPRIDQVADLLPGANCGGCGFAGCRNFAENIVKNESLENMFCPVGGNDLLKQIGPIIGQIAEEKEPTIAVVRCNGSFTNAPVKTVYDGAKSCFFMHNLYPGDNSCPYSCLGAGDCVVSCQFDAIYIDEKTGLPVVIEEKCVACGACVKACPRMIIELRKKGKKSRRIFVSCVNKEKGAISRKNCTVSCIGCGKCVKECKFEAITLENNLAYIDFNKCTLCRKCVVVCPQNSIIELNFPERKAPQPTAEVVEEK